MNAVLVLLAWEAAWWARRRFERRRVYERALADARASGRPLVVVGAPDQGVTAGYDCGDLTIDLYGSFCPQTLRADITKSLPLGTDSSVIFVSCVLEYVDDLDAALAELRRVSGGHLHVVRVEPWTLAAYFYPGARRTLSAEVVRAPGRRDVAGIYSSLETQSVEK